MSGEFQPFPGYLDWVHLFSSMVYLAMLLFIFIGVPILFWRFVRAVERIAKALEKSE